MAEGPGDRQARIERSIAAAFTISALASIAFAIAYLVGDQPQLEGALLAIATAGLGYGTIRWARALMPRGPFEQARSTPPLGDPLEEKLEAAVEAVPRRAFLGRMLGAAIGALGLASLFPIRSLGPNPGRDLFTTAWGPGARLVDPEGTPVRVETLDVGGILTVFPEGHTAAADSQTLLIRLTPDEITPVAGREDWSPEGYVAYSKICTHAGCPVGLYESEARRLFCPCHQSAFDVVQGARPVAGPAPRPLPQLPIEVTAEGYLVAQSDYQEPVGPGFWNAPDG